jgi:hypothetical protein
VPRQLIRFLLIAAPMLAIQASPVVAAPGAGDEVSSGGASNGVIAAEVSYSADGESSVSGSGECAWSLLDGTMSVGTAVEATWPYVRDGVTHHLWQRACAGGIATFWDLAERQPQDLVPQLLEQLRTRALPKPSPSFVRPGGHAASPNKE